MSVRANGSGDHLAVNVTNFLTTTDFWVGGWFKPLAISATHDVLTLGTGETNPGQYLAFYLGSDGSLLWADDPYSTESSGDTGVNASTGTWYYVVVQRSGTTITARVFDDSTSTTPLGTATVTGAGDNLGVDWFVLGEAFAGETFDGELEGWRCRTSETLSDAQARAESQDYDPVLGGGSSFGNWRAKDIDADDDGLLDSVGANDLVNTGCVAGASTPTQLGVPAATHLPPDTAHRPFHQTMVAM